MSNPAKDAYHVYQTAMGKLDAPAFEHLSMWEQEAWAAVACDTQIYRHQISGLIESVRRAQKHSENAEYTLGKLKEDITELQDDTKPQLMQIEQAFRKLADQRWATRTNARWDCKTEIADARQILDAVRERITGLGDRKKVKR